MSHGSHEKREIALRYWLQGRGYHRALEAMEFARSYHKGTRKDGVTPAFSHFVEIAHYVRTLSAWLRDPETYFCAVFLHDVREDFDVDDVVIRTRWGNEIADAVERLTKKFRGVSKDRAAYFAAIAACPIASVVKGCDRIHNVQSMVGVFTLAKQQSYLGEVRTDFLPMLKKARRLFPALEPALENVKQMLVSQIRLVEAIHEAAAA